MPRTETIIGSYAKQSILMQANLGAHIDTSDLQQFVRVFLEQVILVENNYLKMFNSYQN